MLEVKTEKMKASLMVSELVSMTGKMKVLMMEEKWE